MVGCHLSPYKIIMLSLSLMTSTRRSHPVKMKMTTLPTLLNVQERVRTERAVWRGCLPGSLKNTQRIHERSVLVWLLSSLFRSFVRRAVDVWIESLCANMQPVTEIEVKWLKKMRSNQCFRKPSVFK